jgi:hypothetical protein
VELFARKASSERAMTNPSRRRSTLAVIVIVIAILSGAILIQFGGRTVPPVQPGTTTSSSGSSTLTTTTSSSSSKGQSPALVGFSVGGVGGGAYSGQPFFSELPVTPSAAMNYSMIVSQIDATVSHVALSAMSTVPGVTAVINPKEFTFLGNEEGVSLQISVDPSVSSPTVPIQLIATTSKGVTNSTLPFTLEKELVVVVPGANGWVRPITLHASLGQTVKWLDLVPVDDDGNGYITVKLADGSGASPTMAQFDIWSHKFDRPGTYTYQMVVIYASITYTGTIEVG